MTETSRLDALEIRFAHQEQTVNDLSEIVTTQWQHIEKLESQIKRLSEELQNMDQGRGSADQKPPHY